MWINPNGPQPTNPDGPAPYGGGFWPAIAMAAGSIYDTYQTNRTAKKNTELTIAAQREEAEKAYQRSIQMWQMQNAYNTPAQQMQRFGAAGLNANLIYGQGNAGNANNAPSYQAPNLQYRYEAPAYGAAINSLLPTLMGVGTWMQNMRMSETVIREKETGMDKTLQLIEFLKERNPRALQGLDNALSLFPYQNSMMRESAQKAQVGVADALEEFRYKWGAPLEGLQWADYTHTVGTGGRKSVELLDLIAKQRLAQNKADWSDYGITDPQNMYTMLLRGVLGLTSRMMGGATQKQPFKQPWTPPRINQKARPVGLSNTRSARRKATGRKGFTGQP